MHVSANIMIGQGNSDQSQLRSKNVIFSPKFQDPEVVKHQFVQDDSVELQTSQQRIMSQTMSSKDKEDFKSSIESINQMAENPFIQDSSLGKPSSAESCGSKEKKQLIHGKIGIKKALEPKHSSSFKKQRYEKNEVSDGKIISKSLKNDIVMKRIAPSQEIVNENKLKSPPVQLSPGQLGQRIDQFNEMAQKSISPAQQERFVDKQIQKARTLKSSIETNDKLGFEGLLNPYHKQAKEKKDVEKETWKQLHTKTRFSEETVEMFSSIKDVFKKRVQFNEQSQRLKEKLERRCKIGHHEFNQFKPAFIRVKLREKTFVQAKRNYDSKVKDMDEDDEQNQSLAKKWKAMYDESMALIKDEVTFYVHGRYYRFSKNSLGIFGNKTQFRVFLVWLCTSKWFENTIISLILLNSLFLGIKDYTDTEQVTPINQFVESLEPFFTYIFLFECLSKIVAMGFLLGSNSYLSDAWNWLDFTVVVTSLLNELPSMKNMSGLRTFRLFRPLRSLTTMPSMKLLIGTLLSSVSQLGGIMGLAIFFFMIFAILGVSLWDGKIHFRCYETQWPEPDGTWNLIEDYPFLCSDEGSQCPKGYCNSKFVAYDEGYSNFSIVPGAENETFILSTHSDIYALNYGITNFDNIGSAFLTIFQCITLEGWTKIMNIYEDAFNSWFVNLYFISCVVICSFFLLNLTIAVMLMKYEELDKTQANSKHNEELRQLGIGMKLPPPLTEFLIQQDNLQIQSGTSKLLRQEDSFIKQLFAKKMPRVNLQKKYYKNKVVRVCFSIINNGYFDATIIFVIILNTFFLALDKYPEFDEWMLELISIFNFIFTIIFTAEAVFKIIGLGFREFAKETFNLFDLLIVIISIAELQFSGETGPGVFSSFRAFRLFKIFRLFRVGDLRILLDSITFTLTTIGDYVVLLLLFIYVFALIGMSFFAGKLKFDKNDKFNLEEGESPRTHFDDLVWSVITIFQVLLGEGWNEIMYQCYRSVGLLSAVYFVGLVITGNIIMLNLFLAILLGNFDKARNFGQKKKVFEAFKEIMHDGYSINEALDIILGDMSIYVKTKILKWDQKEVDKIHQQGDTKIAIGLMEDGAQFLTCTSGTIQNDNMIEKQIDYPITGKMDESKRQQANEGNDEQNGSLEKRNSNEQVENEYFKLKKASTQNFPRIIECVHRQGKIKRMREMSRQFRIFPYKGLKEILRKQEDLSDVRSLNQSEIEQYRQNHRLLGRGNRLEEYFDSQLKLNSKPVKPKHKISSPSRGQQQQTDKATNQEKLTFEMGVLEIPEDEQILNSQRHLWQTSLHENEYKLDPHSARVQNGMKSQNLPQTAKIEDQIQKFEGDYKKFRSQVQDDGKQSNSEQIEHDEFEEEAVRSITERIRLHLEQSSIFLFHRNWKIRQACMQLAETPEVLAEYKSMEKDGILDDYNELSGKGSQNQISEQDSARESQNDIIQIQKKRKSKKQPLSKQFDNFILTVIILSSILLAVDNPYYDPDSGLVKLISTIDVIFTILFTIEAAIKIIAKGLIWNNLGPISPYLSSSWNQLDFFVVFAALFDLFFRVIGVDMSSLQALKALRALRALRPLRVISKNEGMRLVVNALLASIPSMTNVLLVCTLFILIFSIMGVNYFKGTFFRCYDNYETNYKIDISKVSDKTSCIDQGGLWLNAPSNFDNTFGAMSTLFQMMTTEGWVNVMYNGIDSTGIDKEPSKNANVWLILYFMSFMIIGSQFIINLFVGVVIDNFNTIKEKEELGNMFVTEQQRSWIEIQKLGQGKKLRRKIKVPEGFQLPFYWLVNHRNFEYTITFFILLNTIVMAMKKYRMSQQLNDFSETSNYVFSFVFNLEMILKLIGLGKVYFFSTWNIFDMVIVIATDFGLILKVFELGDSFSSAATVIRGFRIMRMFKLIRSSVHIRLILDTVFNILPQISNVLSLILLLFFIYAALGINLFSGVMLQNSLDKKNNFQTFQGSMIILMKFSTGEDWNAFMYELANLEGYEDEECVETFTYKEYKEAGNVMKGCGTTLSYLFFFSFTILVSMLIMNLSVAAVIEGLDTAKKENMGIVQGDEIEQLIDQWQDYDPDASGWITIKDLVFLLYELPPPLGKRSNKIHDQVQQEPDYSNQGLKQQDRYLINYEKRIVIRKVDTLDLLKDLKIEIHADPITQEKKVHFVNVFRALMQRVFEDKKIDYKLSPNLNKKIKNQWDKKYQENGQDKCQYTAREEQAGLIITRWVTKKLKQQQQVQKKIEKKQKAENKKDEPAPQDARQRDLKELAKIIYNNIHGIDSNEGKDKELQNQYGAQFKIKNSYEWKKEGGDKLLAHLDQDTVSVDNLPSESSDPGIDREIILQKEMQAARAKQQLINAFTKGMNFNNGKPKDLKEENPDQIQINIVNMDNGQTLLDDKQVFVFSEKGVPKRNESIEATQISIAKKTNEEHDHLEDIKNMPNVRYNLKQTKLLMIKHKQAQERERLKVLEEKKAEMMMPDLSRKKEHLDHGITGSTIVMDERFFRTENYHLLQEMQEQGKKSGGVMKEMLLDENDDNLYLATRDQPIEDLFGESKEHIYYPSKAQYQDQKKLSDLQIAYEPVNHHHPIGQSFFGRKSVTNKRNPQLGGSQNWLRDKTPANRNTQVARKNNFL